MKNKFTILLGVIIGLTAIGYLAVADLRSSVSGQERKTILPVKTPGEKKIKLNSLSSAVQLILLDKSKQEIVVEIKNLAEKEITAYQIGLDDGSKLLVDRSISGIYLKPNDVYNQVIRLQNVEDEISEEDLEITLETVIFSDNSSDGNVKVATYIKERRLGIKRQLENLIPTLEELDSRLRSNLVSDVPSFVKTTKRNVENLSFRSKDDSSKGLTDGLTDGKQTIDRVLINLEENLQKSMPNSFESYSGQVNELKKWLQRLQK